MCFPHLSFKVFGWDHSTDLSAGRQTHKPETLSELIPFSVYKKPSAPEECTNIERLYSEQKTPQVPWLGSIVGICPNPNIARAAFVRSQVVTEITERLVEH